MTDLSFRLARLEKSDRRWRIAATTLAALLALTLFLGQAQPERPEKSPVEELRAARIVIVDKEGAERIVLGTENDGPSLTLKDSRGRGVLRLQVPKVPDKAGIYLSDPGESADVELALTQNGPVLHFYDKTGTRVRLATNELNAPLAAINDDAGRPLFEVKGKK